MAGQVPKADGQGLAIDNMERVQGISRSPEGHLIIRASVRECLETWRLQTQAGSVTVEALEPG
jgi:hypothetical protein